MEGDCQKPSLSAPPSLAKLGTSWFRVGIESFGGGAVSLELIRREFIEKGGYFTEEEFVKLWALCQVTPGVNQLALAVAIGRELAGWRGVFVCTAAFILPSAAVTVLLAWGYSQIQGLSATKHAFSAVIPATAGLGIATVVRIFVPVVTRTHWLTVSLSILAIAAGLFIGLPVFAVLLGGGLLGTIGFLLAKGRGQ